MHGKKREAHAPQHLAQNIKLLFSQICNNAKFLFEFAAQVAYLAMKMSR